MERPKRPLSAYNLFYRFKRSKILEAHKNGDDSKETINRLIAASPGLEEHPLDQIPPENVKEFRRNAIRSVLLDHLSPKDNSKRAHSKSHGAMSFLEMNKSMVASWKSIDGFAMCIFEELAEVGRKDYQTRISDYEEECRLSRKKKSKTNPKKAKNGKHPRDEQEALHLDPEAAERAKSIKRDRPKRPLSAYNLFYRFKRSKILEAHKNGDDSNDSIL
mmetsp:Transcript_1142/g.1997  ORF Transcript_1142/g.1997 Transcript_1142/m.1997 type:complete len:218 (+) Transcript_1142:198-851(+)